MESFIILPWSVPSCLSNWYRSLTSPSQNEMKPIPQDHPQESRGWKNCSTPGTQGTQLVGSSPLSEHWKSNITSLGVFKIEKALSQLIWPLVLWRAAKFSPTSQLGKWLIDSSKYLVFQMPWLILSIIYCCSAMIEATYNKRLYFSICSVWDFLQLCSVY